MAMPARDDLSRALNSRVAAVEEATRAFRDAVLDYHALADADRWADAHLDDEAARVVDAWMAVEGERKQLDAVVRDLGATFRVTVGDGGRQETTTITPTTMSGLLQATYRSVQNVTDIDPHPRYTEDDAVHLLTAFDANYTVLAEADRIYVDALDILAPYDTVIERKQERAARRSALDDPYREIDRVLAACPARS